MGDEGQSWVELRIGVTDDEAIAILERLATPEDDLRDRLEKDPGKVFRELKIDFFPKTEPQQVQLPDRDKLLEYVAALRETKDFGPPYTFPLSHGYIVLLVSHGSPPPPPPPSSESSES